MAIRVSEWVDVDKLATGSRHAFDFAITHFADGSSLTVPVQVAIGSRRRPRCVAIAGIHGDEPEGMLALLDFWRGCDPTILRGTVILIPVANSPAFAAHQRRSPVDGLDLNRIFPGNAEGTPSERLAYHLIHDIVAGADFVFTLHSWFATGMVSPYAELPEGTGTIAQRSRDAAVAAGFTRLREGGWIPGVLGTTAVELGVPVIEAEIGGGGRTCAENRRTYEQHFVRLLQHLGILEGTPPPNPVPEFYDRGMLYAPTGGMLRLRVSPGERVEAGAGLAAITDLHGEPLVEMRAPYAGLVAAVRQFVSVNPGELVIALFPRRR
ncbi:MAG TPA: succinylglutamate desuccinylase/aspartoacylase family protein [bacterium]|nr:succinylglutamate desuccinylase/aspartoacylase family protein [bacterium]